MFVANMGYRESRCAPGSGGVSLAVRAASASRWSGIVLHKELFCSSREAARRRLDSRRDAGATKELQQAN